MKKERRERKESKDAELPRLSRNVVTRPSNFYEISRSMSGWLPTASQTATWHVSNLGSRHRIAHHCGDGMLVIYWDKDAGKAGWQRSPVGRPQANEGQELEAERSQIRIDPLQDSGVLYSRFAYFVRIHYLYPQCTEAERTSVTALTAPAPALALATTMTMQPWATRCAITQPASLVGLQWVARVSKHAHHLAASRNPHPQTRTEKL